MNDPDAMVDPLELAWALLENGDSLLADATLLSAEGRRTRAAALSLTAAEEFSKVYLCVVAMTDGAEIPHATSRAWKSHRDKVAAAVALEPRLSGP